MPSVDDHLTNTIHALTSSSRIVSDAVAAGTLGVVGCQYQLHAVEAVIQFELLLIAGQEGRVAPIVAVGRLSI